MRRCVTFGESPGADVRAYAVVADRGFDGHHRGRSPRRPGTRPSRQCRLPGRAQLSNVLAAVAVAVELRRAPRIEIETRVAGRCGRSRGAARPSRSPNGARLVDDSYNASPAAVQAMLSVRSPRRPAAGRRIAVLGEMLELGDRVAARCIEACGRAAADAGRRSCSSRLAAPTPTALPTAPSRAGCRADAHPCALPTAPPRRRPWRALVSAGDLVLVKGSRGTRTDLVVDRLREAD